MTIPLVVFVLHCNLLSHSPVTITYGIAMTQHVPALISNMMSFCTSAGFFYQSFKTPFMAYAKSGMSFQLDVILGPCTTFALIFCGIIIAGISLFASASLFVLMYPDYIKPCFATGDMVVCFSFIDSVLSMFISLPTLLTVVYHLASCVIIAKAFEKYYDVEITPIVATIEDYTADQLER